jgi:predicted glutamine amidotransferase
MCRLFLLLQNQEGPKKKTVSLLETFLAQSIHVKKTTPGLQNPRDLHQHCDGYGFAYTSSVSNRYENHNTKWSIYKKPHISKEDPDIDQVLETVAESPVILGHIRSASKGMAVAYENTHPFHYKNQVFMHNGQIHGFTPLIRLALVKHILPKFRPSIKGTTDSEVLFYLFLTQSEKMQLKDSAKSLIEAFQRTISILKNAGIREFAGNIVFANKTHILVTRYLLHDSANFPKKQTPNSLYISDVDCRTCISSEPVSKKRATLIPENVAMVFSIGKDHVFEKMVELPTIY